MGRSHPKVGLSGQYSNTPRAPAPHPAAVGPTADGKGSVASSSPLTAFIAPDDPRVLHQQVHDIVRRCRYGDQTSPHAPQPPPPLPMSAPLMSTPPMSWAVATHQVRGLHPGDPMPRGHTISQTLPASEALQKSWMGTVRGGHWVIPFDVQKSLRNLCVFFWRQKRSTEWFLSSKVFRIPEGGGIYGCVPVRRLPDRGPPSPPKTKRLPCSGPPDPRRGVTDKSRLDTSF